MPNRLKTAVDFEPRSFPGFVHRRTAVSSFRLAGSTSCLRGPLWRTGIVWAQQHVSDGRGIATRKGSTGKTTGLFLTVLRRSYSRWQLNRHNEFPLCVGHCVAKMARRTMRGHTIADTCLITLATCSWMWRERTRRKGLVGKRRKSTEVAWARAVNHSFLLVLVRLAYASRGC